MIGKTLAHYEVTARLGAGGMGEVVRARDTKLGRDVALKILPASVANDPERLARFQREAQLLASLNHPNIAAIHGVEEADGVRFLVMELADGQDLQVRLRSGALPLEDVIAIARGIAEGLEEAHERGVVHRDLKPTNVMVSDAGKVKILDFGLARAYSGERSDEGDPALSPTITAAMTSAGTVLGSAAYMSPEQAKGRELDRRTDIWAFGVILYEMITGQRLFDGETVSETMAAVLKDPIDLELLPSDVPVAIRSLLARCLERDPMQRLRDIGEARIHLDPSAATRVLSGSAPRSEAERAPKGRATLLPWALFAVAALVAIWFAMRTNESSEARDPAPLRAERYSLETPEGTSFHLSGANPGPLTLSPDGSKAVFAARDQSQVQRLWLRDFQLELPEEIPGTEGGQYPFWSPDGRAIAYYSSSDLRIAELDSRTNRTVATAASGKGGAWLDDDTILFTRGPISPIELLDLATGESRVVTRLSDPPAANSHRLPRDLGNGRNFLFAARPLQPSNDAPVAILIGDIEGGPGRLLMHADGQAEFANGHVLFGLEGNLYARPFDVEALEFSGPPVLLANGVGLILDAALTLLSASGNGMLAFHPGERTTLLSQLEWIDFDGKKLGQIGQPVGFGYFDIAPNGKQLAFTSFDNRLGTGDLFVQDLESGVRTRLTFDAADERHPLWSADSRSIYYLVSGPTMKEVRLLEPDGRGDPRIVYADSTIVSIDDVSADGTLLAYTAESSDRTTRRVFLLSLDGSGEVRPVDPEAGNSGSARFSPDDKWIAYASASGSGSEWHLYLKTNPPGSRKWEVTSEAAYWYDWHPDGDRIYHQFASPDILVTPIDLSGSSPAIGATRVEIEDVKAPLSDLHRFRIAPDGQRFLMLSGDNMDDDQPARVILNWPQIVREAAR